MQTRKAITISQASCDSAIHCLGARRKMLHSRTIAAELRGDVRPTTGLCEVGVRRMKVLREKAQCRSSSSIHIDYNQPLVGGLSVHSTPARKNRNVSLHGGSTLLEYAAIRGVTLNTLQSSPGSRQPQLKASRFKVLRIISQGAFSFQTCVISAVWRSWKC